MNSFLIAHNIVKRVFRNRKEAAALLLLPILLVIIMSIALSQPGEEKLNVGLTDLDKGFLSERLATHIGKLSDIKVFDLNESDYETAVKSKRVKVSIVIPAGFSEAAENGKKAPVEFYADAEGLEIQGLKQKVNQFVSTIYEAGRIAQDLNGKSNEYKNAITGKLLEESEVQSLLLQYRQAGEGAAVEQNPGALSAIGFVVVFIMILIFTTVGIIMEDKKKLTLARIYVSSVNEWEIILGNLLGSLVLGVIQLIPVVITLKLVFHTITYEGSSYLFLILFCFLIAAIGLGIGMSGIIKNTVNPTTIIATVITPTSILGGCFIPDSMMPDLLRKIGYAVPQKWVMDAIQQVLQGDGIRAIFVNLVIIIMFGLVFATFGLKTIRPLND